MWGRHQYMLPQYQPAPQHGPPPQQMHMGGGYMTGGRSAMRKGAQAVWDRLSGGGGGEAAPQSGPPPGHMHMGGGYMGGPSAMPDRFSAVTGGAEAPAAQTQRTMTLEERAAEVKCGLEDELERQDCPYIEDLKYQLAQSYYWSGIFLKDMFFFVCNWHPFFGMLLSHPQHPWSKRERVLTFIVSCSLTMLPSAVVIKYFPGEVRSGVIFIFITLPVSLIEVALYWLSVGGIFCTSLPGPFKACCMGSVWCLKHSCLCMSMLVSVSVLSLSLLLLELDESSMQHPEHLVDFFWISRLQSYIMWFPIWFLLPCLGFLHVWFMEKDALRAAGR